MAKSEQNVIVRNLRGGFQARWYEGTMIKWQSKICLEKKEAMKYARELAKLLGVKVQDQTK